MTLQKIYVFVLLVGTLITLNVARPDIFQPPNASDVSQINGTSTPWVISKFIPTIEEFKNNVFEGLMNDTTVQSIWDIKTESPETRAIYFKILNKFLDNLGHPVPAALANIVSKAGSLFEPMEMAVFFEADSIHVAEFLLNHGVEVNRETATRYVDSISLALQSTDTTYKDSVWQAILTGYANFVASYGYVVVDVIDELLELFASEVIVLYYK